MESPGEIGGFIYTSLSGGLQVRMNRDTVQTVPGKISFNSGVLAKARGGGEGKKEAEIEKSPWHCGKSQNWR